MQTKIKLKIADIIIEMRSQLPLVQYSRIEKKLFRPERFDNFICPNNAKPDIIINVNIVKCLPETNRAKEIFVTYHTDGGFENWRLFKKASAYIYKSPLKDKKQLMFINKTFNRVTAYLLPKKDRGWVWNIDDIIYDFLQVLLINYFALHKKGIFVHSVAVKDKNGKGLLFAGKSGAGKSTTAKLWYKHSRAMVLNDDRIIVRKLNHKFFIYGSPWHGTFSDYLKSRIESAPLKKLFFIYHSPNNAAQQISPGEAFNQLYPALFPTFWDKRCLENIVSISQDLVKDVKCFSLGFANDKKIISFVRRI